MKGWDDIFVAMRECVKLATAELQQYVDEENSRASEIIQEADQKINHDKKK